MVEELTLAFEVGLKEEPREPVAVVYLWLGLTQPVVMFSPVKAMMYQTSISVVVMLYYR